MIESLSERVAIALKKANEGETASVAVMKYSLIIVFNFIITVILSLSIGAMTGKLAETAITIFSACLIRFVSGGFHFKSAVTCTLASILILTVIPHIPISERLNLYFTLFGLLFVILFAPSNIRGVARLPEKYFPLLKLISVLFVSSNFLINSRILALVFLIQGISLIRWERGGRHETSGS